MFLDKDKVGLEWLGVTLFTLYTHSGLFWEEDDSVEKYLTISTFVAILKLLSTYFYVEIKLVGFCCFILNM